MAKTWHGECYRKHRTATANKTVDMSSWRGISGREVGARALLRAGRHTKLTKKSRREPGGARTREAASMVLTNTVSSSVSSAGRVAPLGSAMAASSAGTSEEISGLRITDPICVRSCAIRSRVRSRVGPGWRPGDQIVVGEIKRRGWWSESRSEQNRSNQI